MVLACMGVSIGGYSSVDNLVAMVGALGCVPLAVVFPALFHWKLVTAAGSGHADEGRTYTVDIFIVAFGLVGLSVAVSTATFKWIESSFHPQHCDPSKW